MACAAAIKYTEANLTMALKSAVQIRAHVGFWTIDTIQEALAELLRAGKCAVIIRNDIPMYRLPS